MLVREALFYHGAMPRRKAMKMLAHEREVLVTLYIEYDVPSDQYPHRSAELRAIVGDWNTITGRSETESDVLHYMVSQRKQGKWVKLGRNAGANARPVKAVLSTDELQTLDEIHEELQIASDRFALEPQLAEQLKQEFAKRTGRIVPAMPLASAMISRRKSGSLATLRPTKDNTDIGFSDFDEVVG